jgi:VanZ family protein
LFEYLEKRKIWLVYLPLAVFWLVIFIATSLPANRLPNIVLSDKINHFIAYFALSILVYLTLIYQRKSRFLFDNAVVATISLCLLYGVIDELHQMFIPGRFAETLDWFADSLGSISGVVLLKFLIARFRYQAEFN